jgi:hypothetical protein
LPPRAYCIMRVALALVRYGIEAVRRPSFADGKDVARIPTEGSRQMLPTETDCLAGHIGLEPANPSASYLIGIAWQLRLRAVQLRRRRPFAFQLHDPHLQLGPRFQQLLPPLRIGTFRGPSSPTIIACDSRTPERISLRPVGRV